MPNSHISKKIRSQVFLRAKNRCEYCQYRSDIALESFEVEHIIPLALGGTDELKNLALVCRGCNSRKSIKIHAAEPKSGISVEIFNPRKHSWKTHFQWEDGFLRIQGKTDIGRASIQALKLNRKGIVNLRELMVLGNMHPPLDTL